MSSYSNLSVSQEENFTSTKYEENLTVINIAIKEEKIETVATLLSQFSNLQINLSNQNHVAMFYLGSISGNVDLLKKFKNLRFPVNSPLTTVPESLPALQKYSGFTGLHFAVMYHRLDAVRFFLSQGANIFIPDNKRITPLHVLFYSKLKMLEKHGSVDTYNKVIKIILQSNQQTSDNQENHGVSEFHIACTRDEPETIQNFLHKNETYINQTIGAFPGHEGFSPLHFAVKYNCIEVVRFLLANGSHINSFDHNNMTVLHLTEFQDIAHLLLQHGADITLQDLNGNTPLHKAFEERNYKMMDVLLSAHINNKANPSNAIGISHFHIACTRNNEDVVKLFLQNGVSVNSRVPIDLKIEYTCYWDDIDWHGCSPLHFAVAFNKSKIVELLLFKNASVEIQDVRGFTALHLACRSMHEKFEEFMMNNWQNYSIKRINCIDWTSHRKNHIDIIKMLLEHKSDVNHRDNFKNTPVSCAYDVCYALDDSRFLEKHQKPARDNFLQEMLERRRIILELLLQHPVNLDTCRNDSILHHMIKEAQVSDSYSGKDELGLLEMFLKKGLTVDVLNKKMLTPLYAAIQKMDRTDFMLLLIEYGADVNFHEPEKHSTILHLALESYRHFYNYDPSIIINAALRKGANPNARRLNETTVLHDLACTLRLPQSSEIFQSLIEAGADVNACDAKGQSALFKACLCCNEEMVQMLLHHGADVNLEDNTGKTVLCMMYEEMLVKVQASQFSHDFDKQQMLSVLKVILKYVTKKRNSVTEKVLLSQGKIMNYLTSNEISWT